MGGFNKSVSDTSMQTTGFQTRPSLFIKHSYLPEIWHWTVMKWTSWSRGTLFAEVTLTDWQYFRCIMDVDLHYLIQWVEIYDLLKVPALGSLWNKLTPVLPLGLANIWVTSHHSNLLISSTFLLTGTKENNCISIRANFNRCQNLQLIKSTHIIKPYCNSDYKTTTCSYPMQSK